MGISVGFDVVGLALGVDVGVEVGWDDGLEVGSNVGSEVGLDVGLDVGVELGVDVADVGEYVGVAVGADVGVSLGFDVSAVEGMYVLGCEVGGEEGFDVVGRDDVGEYDVGSDVPALIFVTSFVGLNVVGLLVGVRLIQPFTKRQILPLPDSFPVEMVSDGSVLHLRLNLIWIFVLLVKAARVDISQHDS